jgi:hypothetical protein
MIDSTSNLEAQLSTLISDIPSCQVQGEKFVEVVNVPPLEAWRVPSFDSSFNFREHI